MGIQRKRLVLKGGSHHCLPTHFIICFNRKSELTSGPSDFSVELSSPSIPALMNHSDSWLPPGISSTTLSLSKFSEEHSPARDPGQPSLCATGDRGIKNVMLELSRSVPRVSVRGFRWFSPFVYLGVFQQTMTFSSLT